MPFVTLGPMIALIGACAASHPGPKAAPAAASAPANLPAWTKLGTRILEVQGELRFVAVGHKSGIRNEALLVSTARLRARAELQRLAESLMPRPKWYGSSCDHCNDIIDRGISDDGMQRIDVAPGLVAQGASECRPLRRGDAVYVLVHAPVRSLLEALGPLKGPDRQVRGYVAQRISRLEAEPFELPPECGPR